MIGILSGMSFLLVLCAFAYLAFEDFVGETRREQFQNAVQKNVKLIVYLVCSFFCLVVMAFVLRFVYPSNTLISNMKIITLLGLLVTVTITDIRKQIIPNKVILAGIFLRVCFAVAELITMGGDYFTVLKNDLFSLILVFVLFLFGVLIMKNGIGMGDIKLILVMGIFQGITGVISSLFFSLFVSFCVAIVMLIMRKKTRKDAIAFAPSVLVGTAISMLLTGM